MTSVNDKIFKVALIGKPNAGKSSLFNRIIRKRKAITTHIPGTTRDWNEEVVFFDVSETDFGAGMVKTPVVKNLKTPGVGPAPKSVFKFILVDTAGIELKVPKGDVLKEKAYEKLEKNLKTVDFFIFVADRETGITREDTKIIRDARKYGKQIFPVVNKIDHAKDESAVAEFNKLGLGKPLGVSATMGRGIVELLGIIREEFASEVQPRTRLNLVTEEIKVAILGRPNVGKSSFLNKLIQEEKFIVSEIPGTTRDVNSTYLEHKEKIINFLDTAGLRRRGKIGKTPGKKKEGIIEKFSAERVKETLAGADIAILVLDPTEMITSQDLHIAGYIKDEYKGIIIVVNKWDLAKEEKLSHGFDTVEKFSRLAQHKFDFLPYAPLIFVSSLTGKNVEKVLDLILEIKGRRETRIPTGELNTFFNKVVLRKPPVSTDRHQVNIKYVTQADINPPTFVLFANYPEKVHFSYQRYLENRIRENWDFTGTPIKIIFKSKNAK